MFCLYASHTDWRYFCDLICVTPRYHQNISADICSTLFWHRSFCVQLYNCKIIPKCLDLCRNTGGTAYLCHFRDRSCDYGSYLYDFSDPYADFLLSGRLGAGVCTDRFQQNDVPSVTPCTDQGRRRKGQSGAAKYHDHRSRCSRADASERISYQLLSDRQSKNFY